MTNDPLDDLAVKIGDRPYIRKPALERLTGGPVEGPALMTYAQAGRAIGRDPKTIAKWAKDTATPDAA